MPLEWLKTSAHHQAKTMSRSTFIPVIIVGIVLMVTAHAGCSRNAPPELSPPAPRSVEEVSDLPGGTTPTGEEATANLVDDTMPNPPTASLNSGQADGAAIPPLGRDVSVATASQPVPPGSLQESLDKQAAIQGGEEMLADLGYTSPADRVKALLDSPPGAVRISKSSPLWIDVASKRVFVDGYVAQREAYLEMFACDTETKEHESILGVAAKSSEVHAALLAIGAAVGKTVRFEPEYVPASGQPIRIWVMWYDEQGKFQAMDAKNWVRNTETKKSLDRDWVFAGSVLWKDPSDGKEYYQADSGEMICVSNFSTALMDLPIESSDANSQLQFEAFTERIPPSGTAIRLMMVPLPSKPVPAQSPDSPEPVISPTDTLGSSDDDQPPTEALMPLKPQKPAA